MHQQLLICAYCGGPYEPKTDSKGRGRPSLYCSTKHRVYASRARKRAANQQP